ncbi:MAG: benzene 1,2-dioxygenase [Noviherbaspirillum sp.]|jgi:3-phenylpropionate/trans-cinnamate dioxygenase alpha subunit|nr:benzene 1,2-dioxygenase [Noviherbaspirillum sp.]
MIQNFESLVNIEKGLINRQIFSDPDLYAQEQEKIFARCWLYLGHESQLKNPDDFFTTYMGEEPILVTKNGQGKIAAFINACRHRGNRICRLDHGNAKDFTCSYHGWLYDNKGDLCSIPHYKEAYQQSLNKAEWGLIPVAQLATYKGLIFATFDPQAPSLSFYLGEMKWYLDMLVDRLGGVEVIGGIHKWTVNANWKLAAENFVGDMAHAGITHISATRSGFTGGNSGKRSGFEMNPGGGHGAGGYWNEEGSGNFGLLGVSPEANAYYQEKLEEMEQRLGTVRGRHLSMVHGTVFPNFSFLYGTPTIRVFHPRGPEQTEVWSWCIVDKAAPDKVKEDLRLNYLRRFSPAGTWEQDDAENWVQATKSSRGTISRRYPLNYQMGLGREEENKDLAGKAGFIFNEMNQRAFYQHWAQLMAE